MNIYEIILIIDLVIIDIYIDIITDGCLFLTYFYRTRKTYASMKKNNEDRTFIFCKQCKKDTDWYWSYEEEKIQKSLCKTCLLQEQIKKENLIQTSLKNKCEHNFIETKRTSRYEYGWGDEITAHILCNKCGEIRNKIIQYCN